MKTFQKLCLCLLLGGFLGIYNGHLAIFETGKPTQVFPYAAENYPPCDQAALQQGIPYGTPLEKQRILEDFLS